MLSLDPEIVLAQARSQLSQEREQKLRELGFKFGEDAVKLLDEAATEGLPLYAQAAGRAIGIEMCWRGTAHPFALHPTWKALSEKPWDEVLKALREPVLPRASAGGAARGAAGGVGSGPCGRRW